MWKKLRNRFTARGRSLTNLVPTLDAPVPILSASDLLATAEIEDCLTKLRHELRRTDTCPLDRELSRFLETFASYTHLLPASEIHHHNSAGGLIVHSLDTATRALRYCNQSNTLVPRALRLRGYREEMQVPAQLALLLVAASHDLGKVATDVEIRLCDNHGRKIDGLPKYDPHRAALFDTSITDWAKRTLSGRARRAHYRLAYVDGRGSNSHARLWPAAIQAMLQRHPELFVCTRPLSDYFFDFDSCHFNDVIKPLIQAADRDSVSRNLQSSPPEPENRRESVRRLFGQLGQKGYLQDLERDEDGYFLSVRQATSLLQRATLDKVSTQLLQLVTGNARVPDAAYLLKTLRGLRLTLETGNDAVNGHRLQSRSGEPGIRLGTILAREIAYWHATGNAIDQSSSNKYSAASLETDTSEELIGVLPVNPPAEPKRRSVEKCKSAGDVPDSRPGASLEETARIPVIASDGVDPNVRALATYIDDIDLTVCPDQWQVVDQQLIFSKAFFHAAIENAAISRFRLVEHSHAASERWSLRSNGKIVDGIVCTPHYSQQLLAKSDVARTTDQKNADEENHWLKSAIELFELSAEESADRRAALYAKCFFDYLRFFCRSPYLDLPIEARNDCLLLPDFYVHQFAPSAEQLETVERWLNVSGILQRKTNTHYELKLTEEIQQCLT